jgi:hypothetical protein
MLQAQQDVTVKLKAEQWNQVLQVLSDGPFRVVNQLIADIQQQCMAQSAQPPHAPTNGDARPVPPVPS